MKYKNLQNKWYYLFVCHHGSFIKKGRLLATTTICFCSKTNEICFSYRCSKPKTFTVVSRSISHIPIKLCQSSFDILDTKSLHE